MKNWGMLWVGLAVLGLTARGWAAEDLEKKVRDLEQQVESLKRERATGGTLSSGLAGQIDDKARGYGPNSVVTTKAGRLTVSGLVQVWYYSNQKDEWGLYGDGKLNPGIVDRNVARSGNSFGLRRTELKFTMDVHENVQAMVMLDPARENNTSSTYPGFPSSMGTTFTSPSATPLQGTADASRLLQDVYVSFRKLIPYHTFQVGQFKTGVGYEGNLSSSALDTPERTMIGQMFDARDMGARLDGKFFDDRVGYMAGVYNDYKQNSIDNNPNKSFAGGVFARPLQDEEVAGTLELGYGAKIGKHGRANAANFVAIDNNATEMAPTTALYQDAYLVYKAGGPVAGLWLKGEYALFRDRWTGVRNVNALGQIQATSMAVGAPGALVPANVVKPYTRDGWYTGIGYKFGDNKSISSDVLKKLELLYRYETFENILIQDVTKRAAGSEMTGFHTNVHTVGLNYYIKGNNAKVQFNYNLVQEDINKKLYAMRQVNNDSFVMNFQVAF